MFLSFLGSLFLFLLLLESGELSMEGADFPLDFEGQEDVIAEI